MLEAGISCAIEIEAEQQLTPVFAHISFPGLTSSRVSPCTEWSKPLTGESFFLELPILNTQGFPLFLTHFAVTDPSSFHLLLLDKGAFHKARSLRLPHNVGLLFFPPYALELNPIERLWRDLKD